MLYETLQAVNKFLLFKLLQRSFETVQIYEIDLILEQEKLDFFIH